MTDINLLQISEVKLVYSRKVRANDRPQVSQSHDAYLLFCENWDDLTINLNEQFKVMLLDRNNRCMGISTVSTGGVSGTVVDPKLIFALALKGRACNLIVAHNHPSGNLSPSDQDFQITKRLCDVGKCLDLEVLDHLILTDESYYSMAVEGLMPH